MKKENNFFDQCCVNIDQLYPDWTSNGYGNHPICIPECLDVNETWIKAKYNEVTKGDADKLRGQKREKCTLAALQSCTVGGLAVFDFHLSEFRSQFTMEKDSEQLQIDALLFHPHLGICELETKSSAEAVEYAEKEQKQLKCHAAKLRKLFKKVTGCDDDDIPPIRSFYCIPMDKCKNRWPKSRDGRYSMVGEHVVLDKTIFSQEKEFFMDFWISQIFEVVEGSSKFPNYFENKRFTRFAKIIAGFRSHEYFAIGSNVFTIHRYITQQKFNSSQICTEEIENQCVFLTANQKAIIEDQSLMQIIFGVPGSGKTLILMLKALQAAQCPVTERNERVFVFTWSHIMLMKYQQFFQVWKDKCSREILVFRNIRLAEMFSDDSLNPVAPWDRSLNHICSADERKIIIHAFDDLIVDECDWEDAEKRIFKQRIEAHKNCEKAGKSVIVITNPVEFGVYNKYIRRDKNSRINDVKNAKAKLSKFANYCAFYQLNESIRCTGAILDYWRPLFIEQKTMDIRQGHNIRGTEVIVRRRFKKLQDLCAEIHKQIQQHLFSGHSNNDPRLQMKDIVVLLVQQRDLYNETIETKLNILSQSSRISNGTTIYYGDMYSQIKHKSCVAIVHAAVTNSCEWPLVIALESTARRQTHEDKHFQMIARSRATAKLIIFQADFPLTTRRRTIANQHSEEQLTDIHELQCYNILSPVVTIFKRHHFKDLQTLCIEVHKQIQLNLITFRFPENSNARLGAKDIAVLLTPPFNLWSDNIRRKLNKERIKSDSFLSGPIVSYGDLSWQLQDENSVAVGAPHIAPCREWALVLLLEGPSRLSTKFKYEHLFARSRASAKLVIFQAEFHATSDGSE